LESDDLYSATRDFLQVLIFRLGWHNDQLFAPYPTLRTTSMTRCSTESSQRDHLFQNFKAMSSLTSFEHHQPLINCQPVDPEKSSELSSLNESEHNLNEWSTQSYTFSKKSSEGPDVRSLDGSVSDLGLAENNTHSQLHFQEGRPTPVPYQISQPIHFDNSLDIDNQSLAPSEFYASSFVMPQVAVPSTKDSETLVADQDVGYIKILVCGDSGT
jgi:hypothetical protein